MVVADTGLPYDDALQKVTAEYEARKAQAQPKRSPVVPVRTLVTVWTSGLWRRIGHYRDHHSSFKDAHTAGEQRLRA